MKRPPVAATALPVLALAQACLGQASFQGVASLPGYAHSSTTAISGDGRVVAGVCSSQTEGGIPFRWVLGAGITSLEAPPCGGADIAALSFDGSTAVGTACFPTTAGPACYWDAQGALHPLPSAASGTSSARATSPDGTVFAGAATFPGTNARAARWGGSAVPEQLPGSGAWLSSVFAMTPDGSTMVGYASGVNIGAVASIWSGGARLDLPSPWPQASGVTCRARDVSSDGLVVLGWCSTPGVEHPAVWRAAGAPLILPLPPGTTEGEIHAASANAEVSVGFAYSTGGHRATVWTRAGGAVELHPLLESYGLNLDGWLLIRAEAVSDDGRAIAGHGTNPAGFSEGWIATLPDGFGCYANCTSDLTPGGAALLTVADFACFQAKFVAADYYADCNNDNAFTIADFACFQASFVAGCP